MVCISEPIDTVTYGQTRIGVGRLVTRACRGKCELCFSAGVPLLFKVRLRKLNRASGEAHPFRHHLMAKLPRIDFVTIAGRQEVPFGSLCDACFGLWLDAFK